jgi:hypothetical protein
MDKELIRHKHIEDMVKTRVATYYAFSLRKQCHEVRKTQYVSMAIHEIRSRRGQQTERMLAITTEEVSLRQLFRFNRRHKDGKERSPPGQKQEGPVALRSL